MNTIISLPKLSSKTSQERVVVRVDYNVPLVQKEGKKPTIADTRRIESSYATINAILKKGGVPVLVAHLGKGAESLAPVATFLKKIYSVVFVTDDIFSDACAEAIAGAQKGQVILLENIRRYEGEEKNDKALAKRLASFGSYYVNDAFSVSHRAHASVVAITKYLPSMAGIQLQAEIAALTPALNGTKHPFVFILGGAKVGTKLPLLARFVKTADQVVLCGAIVNNFFKVAGFEIGKSVTDEGFDAAIKKILKAPNVLLPVDVIVLRTENGEEKAEPKAVVATLDEVVPGDVIVDIGPQTTALVEEKVSKAKLVVWNGPTGWYEKGFTEQTTTIAKAIVAGKTSAIIGGGDTGAALEALLRKHKDDKAITKRVFVSTGGGAALDFLANGTLPGIKALQ